MLGYVGIGGGTDADALMAEVSTRLAARGWALAGAIQHNHGQGADGRCHMDLEVLAERRVIRISQDLGSGSRGCRLDPSALEAAVGLAEAALAGPVPVRLVIVNKFGKQEIDGRGFRPLIGRALADNVPVLTAVNGTSRAAFLDFAGGLAEEVPADLDAILAWAEGATPGL